MPHLEKTTTTQETIWPDKFEVIGVDVSSTDYTEAANCIVEAGSRHEPAVVSAHAVHAIVEAACDEELGRRVNQFQMVVPDGQPVRWALNSIHRASLTDRVYGPELTLRVCQRAAERGVSIYLYGGSPEVIELLKENLPAKYPELQIAGAESPPFRELTPEEDAEMVARINASGAGIVFIGLGCPKQDHFAYEHRDKINAVQVCVGAAFDFHAGAKKTAPDWMQRRGLEWLFRLLQEPGRLWKRYLVTNSLFVWKFCGQKFLGRKSS